MIRNKSRRDDVIEISRDNTILIEQQARCILTGLWALEDSLAKTQTSVKLEDLIEDEQTYRKTGYRKFRAISESLYKQLKSTTVVSQDKRRHRSVYPEAAIVLSRNTKKRATTSH